MYYLKLLFFSLIFVCCTAMAKQPFDLVISLGDTCQVAYQMTLNKLRYERYPFDWSLTPFESVYQFIQNRSLHFMDKDALVLIDGTPGYSPSIHRYIEDCFYKIQFVHDFDLEQNFLKDYQRIKTNYDRRINRFFSALSSNKKILFIRQTITREQAIRLDKLLQTMFPNLKYQILAIDMSEEIQKNWGLNRIKNYYLKSDPDDGWVGNSKAWENILKNFPVKTQKAKELTFL